MSLLRCILTWVAFGFGHLVSRFPWYPYWLYNRPMVVSLYLQGENTGYWWPWSSKTADGMESGQDYVLGYMCGVDWQHEIGMAEGGNVIYASPENCAKRRKCTEQCGIVEVRVYLNKWVKEQNLWSEEDGIPE